MTSRKLFSFVLCLFSLLSINGQNQELLPFDLYFVAWDSQVSQAGDFKLVLMNRDPIQSGTKLGLTNAMFYQDSLHGYWRDEQGASAISRIEFTNIGQDIPRESVITIKSNMQNQQNPIEVLIDNETQSSRFNIELINFDSLQNRFFNIHQMRAWLYQGTFYKNENNYEELFGSVIHGLWISYPSVNEDLFVPEVLRDIVVPTPGDDRGNTGGGGDHGAGDTDLTPDDCCEEDKTVKQGLVYLPINKTQGDDIDIRDFVDKEECECPEELEILVDENCMLSASNNPCGDGERFRYYWTSEDPYTNIMGTGPTIIDINGVDGSEYTLTVICDSGCEYVATTTVDCSDCVMRFHLVDNMDCSYTLIVENCSNPTINWYEEGNPNPIATGPNFTPPTDGNYSYEIIGCANCYEKIPFTVLCNDTCEDCTDFGFLPTNDCTLDWLVCAGWTTELTDETGTVLATSAPYTPTENGTYTITYSHPDCDDEQDMTLVNCVEDPCILCDFLGLEPDEDACELSWIECAGWTSVLTDPNGNVVNSSSPYTYSLEGVYTLTYSKPGCDDFVDDKDVLCLPDCSSSDLMATVTATPDLIDCEGSSQLQVTVSGGTAPYTYAWNIFGVPPIPDPVVSPNNTTEFTVIVTDANECQDTASVIVEVEGCPICPDPSANESCTNDELNQIIFSLNCDPDVYDHFEITFIPFNCGGTVGSIYVDDDGTVPDIFTLDFSLYDCGQYTATWTSPCCDEEEIIINIECCDVSVDIIEDDCQLTAVVTGCDNPIYNWSNGESSSSIEIEIDDFYDVTITGCCVDVVSDEYNMEGCQCYCEINESSVPDPLVMCLTDSPHVEWVTLNCTGGLEDIEWSHNGTVFDNGFAAVFDPVDFGIGEHSITITIINPNNGCTGDTYNFIYKVEDCSDPCEDESVSITTSGTIGCENTVTFTGSYTAHSCSHPDIFPEMTLYLGGVPDDDPGDCNVSGGVLIAEGEGNGCELTHTFTENGTYHLMFDVWDQGIDCNYCESMTFIIDDSDCDPCDCEIDIEYDQPNCQIVYSATGCDTWQLRYSEQSDCSGVVTVAEDLFGNDIVNGVYDLSTGDYCGDYFNILGSESGCGNPQVSECVGPTNDCCDDCEANYCEEQIIDIIDAFDCPRILDITFSDGTTCGSFGGEVCCSDHAGNPGINNTFASNLENYLSDCWDDECDVSNLSVSWTDDPNDPCNILITITGLPATITDIDWTPGNTQYVLNTSNCFLPPEEEPVARTSLEKVNTQNYSFYPNPASDIFILEYQNTLEQAFKTLELYDMSGRLVKSESLGQELGLNKQQVDSSLLEPGVYLAKLKTAQQEFIERIIILKD